MLPARHQTPGRPLGSGRPRRVISLALSPPCPHPGEKARQPTRRQPADLGGNRATARTSVPPASRDLTPQTGDSRGRRAFGGQDRTGLEAGASGIGLFRAGEPSEEETDRGGASRIGVPGVMGLRPMNQIRGVVEGVSTLGMS